jgi:sugar phosphate isomerase/epimerase
VPELRIGIQLASLKMPLRKAIETAAGLGANAVEIDARGEINPREFSATGRRQLRKLLEDFKLEVCAVGFRTRRGYNVLEHLQERIEATKVAMDFAYGLGASVVINQVGSVPEPTDTAEWNLLVEVLTDLGNYAQRAGAFLAAETGSESGPRLATLLDALPDGALMVNLDPGNLIVNGFSPLEAVHALGSRIAHVHAKDAVRDLAQGRGLEVPLGRGSTDFPSLLGTLEEYGYRGYFTIERENAADPVREIGFAVQYLRNV